MPVNLDQIESSLSDNEIVERILNGNTALYQLIIRRHNRRLYRVAWAITQDECEAEDVIQETYVRAYEHLIQFQGRSLFSTWLTRIAIHEAWGRMKRRGRECNIDAADALLPKASCVTRTPEDDVLTIESRTVLEEAIHALPQTQRSVFVMRSLEEMSVTEVAHCLDITEQAVKMRFRRARISLQRALSGHTSEAGSQAFKFMGERCDRVTATTLSRIPGLRERPKKFPSK
jgi:RNA polymerase sigma-70 factor (ECF subfamily)